MQNHLCMQYARSLHYDNLLRFKGRVYAACPTGYLAVPLHEPVAGLLHQTNEILITFSAEAHIQSEFLE
jgi:hypothetical protein